MRFRGLLMIVAILGCGGGITRAQTTQPAAGAFVVQQWNIFLIDATQDKLNPDGAMQDSLPDFIDSQRQGGPAGVVVTSANTVISRLQVNGAMLTINQNNNSSRAVKDAEVKPLKDQPQPIGVIRLIGQPDSKVDVALTKDGGDFEASWPKAQVRSTQLLWRDLTLSTSAPSHPLRTVAPEHWFNSLRQGESDYVTDSEGNVERFLLFDVEIPYLSPFTAKGGKDFSAQVTFADKAVLHDVTFYEGDHGHWRQAALERAPATHPAAPSGAARPTTAPGVSPATTIHLSPSPATQPSDLAEQWRPKLMKAGLLEADVDVIVRTLTQYAFNSRRLSAVYLMDDEEYARLLPLEVVPQPTSIVRLAIVIVKNVDTAAGSEIDDWIIQLGDPIWAKRDEAYKALEQVGPPALPKLQTATGNKDMEIAWRAERLIAELHGPTP